MKTTKNKIVYEENINNIKGKTGAIIFPDSGDEIQTAVKLSTTDLIPRGAGTSFTGALTPNNSVVIDLSKMNRILEVNEARKTVLVEPGVLLRELNEKLEDYGLEFPIEAFLPEIETIGGMIAKNSSGSREIKYGRMINWIESLEVVNGKAELIKVSKSDLSDFVGMEGTTGVIIRATLRLTSRKRRSISILKSQNLNEIFNANKKLRLNQDISSIDLIDRDISSLLGFERKYHLFVEYEDDSGLFKEKDYEKFHKLKKRIYKEIASQGYYLVENSKIFMDSIDDFIFYLEDKNIPFYSNFSSGVFYSFFKPDQTEKQLELCKLVKRLKGKVAYNFGLGLTKKDFVEPSDLILIRRIKLRQDPNSKFNKNKILNEKQKVEEQIQEEQEKLIEETQEIQKQPELSETQTIKREEKEEPTPEEREKIKKIAFGFFGAKKAEEDKDNQGGYIG